MECARLRNQNTTSATASCSQLLAELRRTAEKDRRSLLGLPTLCRRPALSQALISTRAPLKRQPKVRTPQFDLSSPLNGAKVTRLQRCRVSCSREGGSLRGFNAHRSHLRWYPRPSLLADPSGTRIDAPFSCRLALFCPIRLRSYQLHRVLRLLCPSTASLSLSGTHRTAPHSPPASSAGAACHTVGVDTHLAADYGRGRGLRVGFTPIDCPRGAPTRRTHLQRSALAQPHAFSISCNFSITISRTGTSRSMRSTAGSAMA